MIPCIKAEYSHKYIADVFWNKQIAKVSSVTLIPFMTDDAIYCIGYIEIAYWFQTEEATNFIQCLNSKDKEARLVDNLDEWWSVKENTHNNGNLDVGTYTVRFDD
jgi:hypothetical protein